MVEERPELNIVLRSLTENDELRKSIENHVGEIISIEYQPKGSSVRRYINNPLREGTYFFNVKGSKGTSTVRVRWRSSGDDGNHCELLKLELNSTTMH